MIAAVRSLLYRACIALLIPGSAAFALPIVQKVNPALSKISFASTSPFVLTGQVEGLRGSVTLDPVLREFRKVQIAANISRPRFQAMPPQLEWIAQGLIEGLPGKEILFESTQFRKVGTDRVDVDGIATMGKRRDRMTIPFMIRQLSATTTRVEGKHSGTVTPSDYPSPFEGNATIIIVFEK